MKLGMTFIKLGCACMSLGIILTALTMCGGVLIILAGG